MASGMRVDELARVAISFPTYAEILIRVGALAAHQLNLPLSWQAHQAEGGIRTAQRVGSADDKP
jgi:dihydrolipoamide dehydrogenase